MAWAPSPFEHGLGVALRGVAYVAALGVGNDQNILGHGGYDALKRCPSGGAVLFEKGEVGFEGRRVPVGCLHDAVAKRLHRLHTGAQVRGIRSGSVQPHAQARGFALHHLVQTLAIGHGSKLGLRGQ